MFVGTGLRRTYRRAKNLVWQFEVIGHDLGRRPYLARTEKIRQGLGLSVALAQTDLARNDGGNPGGDRSNDRSLGRRQ